MAITAKAVTQNPRRPVTPDDIAHKVKNTDGKECREGDQVFVFPDGFQVVCPQISSEKELTEMYKLTPGSKATYVTGDVCEIDVVPTKEEFVDIYNLGILAYYQRRLGKYANNEKAALLGKKKKGRGPADLTKGKSIRNI